MLRGTRLTKLPSKKQRFSSKFAPLVENQVCNRAKIACILFHKAHMEKLRWRRVQLQTFRKGFNAFIWIAILHNELLMTQIDGGRPSTVTCFLSMLRLGRGPCQAQMEKTVYCKNLKKKIRKTSFNFTLNSRAPLKFEARSSFSLATRSKTIACLLRHNIYVSNWQICVDTQATFLCYHDVNVPGLCVLRSGRHLRQLSFLYTLIRHWTLLVITLNSCHYKNFTW